MVMQFSIALFLIMGQSALAGAGGLLFNVSATGEPANVSITLCLNGKGSLSCQTYNVAALTLSIRTAVPNHVYPAAGIKINTPGYELANIGLSCTPNANGYCLFSVNNTTPASISISKTSGYSISGTISNLAASGLVLQNNGSDNLTVSSGATSFQFSTPVAFEGSYNVTVLQQPVNQTCIVTNGSGNNVQTNITNVTVTCRLPLIYFANEGDNTIAICSLENDGSFNNCSIYTDSSFDNPGDVILNNSHTTAYILNTTALSTCPIGSDGTISGACNFVFPGGVYTYGGISPNGTILYLSTWDNNEVAICTINPDGSITTPCPTSSFNQPVGRIGFNRMINYAYITDWGNSLITICPVNIDGTFGSCTTSDGNGTFFRPEGAFVNPEGTMLYVVNLNNTVAICPIINNGGALGTCTTSAGNGTFDFSDIGINLYVNSHFAYLPNTAAETVSICPINPDGTFGTCVTNDGNGLFNIVSSVWIS